MRLLDIAADDTAVSPVIGIILMVAITSILAAVVGTFALGLSDEVQEVAPNADFAFEYDGNEETLEVVHEAGDGIAADELWFLPDSEAPVPWGDSGERVSAGDSVTLEEAEDDFAAGDTVDIVWRGNGKSATLDSIDLPE